MKKQVYTLLLLTCFLGLQDGYLALFREGDAAAYHVFPYRAELYPKADKQALKEGIPFGSQAELSQLLEDYLS